MKKILNLLMILSLAFVSCKDDSSDWEDNNTNPRMITFSVLGNNQKGTSITNDNFEHFNIYAYHHNAPTNADNISSITTEMYDYLVSKSSNLWDYQTTEQPGIAWPDNGFMSFFGVSTNDATGPSGLLEWNDLNKTGNEISFPSFTYKVADSIADQKDLVVAFALDKTSNDINTADRLSLKFKHVLTQINISLRGDPQNFIFTIKDIWIEGVINQGSFTYSNTGGSWTTSLNIKDTVNYSYFSSEAGVEIVGKNYVSFGDADNNNALMLIPQTFSGRIKIKYDVRNPGNQQEQFNLVETKDYQNNNTIWNPGSKIRYNIIIPK